MTKIPTFSFVMIARNEEKTLPRLLSSLEEFKARGGEVCLLDTGSTDKTAELARKWGVKVEEVGEKFLKNITAERAKKINKHFIVNGEDNVVAEGNKLFDFAGARNYAATLASNDFIFTPDCDEVFTKFDIDVVQGEVELGADQLEYNFVFSHDEYGNEAIKFLHCKAYNRRKLSWIGIVHEVLHGEKPTKRIFLNENIVKLEHWQNEETPRGGYLKGLAVDCYENPNSDRNSHYFAREMLWTGRPKSAIKEFKRHIEMKKWPTERAQSMIFMGDAYGMLQLPERQVESYNKAFYAESGRREPLLKLARFYLHNQNYQASICYAKAAMEIPWSSYYANQKTQYTNEPHEILYTACGWIGRIEEAKEHVKKALEFQPENSVYLRDLRFYFDLPFVSIVIPTLNRKKELKRCLEAIKKHANYPSNKYEVIVEKDNLNNRQGAPKTLSKGVARSKGDLVMFLGNDCIPEKDFLIQAVWKMMETYPDMDGLIGLNDMYLKGSPATHWLASKKLLPYLGGNFFYTGYYHNFCDNELTDRCKQIDKYTWAELSKVYHDHPIQGKKFTGKFDEVHKIVANIGKFNSDRELLERRSKELNFSIDKNIVEVAKKLSIVIPVKDGIKMTKECIKSIIENTPSLGEIIIVDDGSTDDYKSLEDVVYIKNKGKGVNAGWVTGLDAAKFPYVCVCNNDILVTKGWAEPLMIKLSYDVWMASPYHTYGELPPSFPKGEEKHNNMQGEKTGLPFIGSCFMLSKYSWSKIMDIDSRLKIWCGDNFIYETITRTYGRQVLEIRDSYIHHFGSKTIDKVKPNVTAQSDIDTFEIIAKEHGWDGVQKQYPWIPRVLDLRLRLPMPELHNMKVLSIGVGDMSSGLAKQLPFLKFKQLDFIDIHQPYIDNAKGIDWASQVSFTKCDMKDFKHYNDYDLVMVFDVFEHLHKKESIKIINEIKNRLLIFGPLELKLKENSDIDAENHLSLWTEKDFKELGFVTEVLKDFHGDGKGNRYNALWAIK